MEAKRVGLLVVLAALGLTPAMACGPFLYDNAELDRLSFLDPGILNSDEWVPFLDFGSPSFGHPGSDTPLMPQPVIRLEPIPPTRVGEVTNLLWEYEAGSDPVSVQANEAWWRDYFRTARGRDLDSDALGSLLYEGQRPDWLTFDEALYFDLLSEPAEEPAALQASLAQARDPRVSPPLRHRYAFWAIRSLALARDPVALTVFREFCPNLPTDLPLARAQGWAASVLAATDPPGALTLWLDLWVRWPELRAQTFASLATQPPDAWATLRSPEALVARFFLDGRDFSPETLGALAVAERAADRDGAWTEAVFYAMAEQVEAEAGISALFGLVDPRHSVPRGLFRGLIDGAQALAEAGVQKPTRTWWLTAASLCLIDGDPERAGTLLDRARKLPSRNPAQEAQTELLATLVLMAAERDRDWSPALQKRLVRDVDWAQTRREPGQNRGLYHSLVVLAAQKALVRGRNVEAALAFGMIQGGPWSNPYQLQADDGFWARGWAENNSLNLFLDVLLTDADLETWKALLKRPSTEPWTARLTAHPFLTPRDLTWWQAHRALRRGEGERALVLYRTLAPGGGASWAFPARTFAASLDLDPVDPGSGRGMTTYSPEALAQLMVRVEAAARTNPTSRSLLTQGQFWLSLQLSGLPLLFAQPPPVVRFVNGNFEYYGYDGRDQSRTTAVVGDYPLGQAGRTDEWSRRLAAFYRDEFSTLGRAREAFEAVVARHEDRDAEYRALLFLQAIDGNRGHALTATRYRGLPLAETFLSTCEAF